MIVYNTSGVIIMELPKTQEVSTFYKHYPKEYVDNLKFINHTNVPLNLFDYKVVDEKLVKMTEYEKLEINIYGRFLTEEERILESMKPSIEEIRKAEKTIELLSLLEGVL